MSYKIFTRKQCPNCPPMKERMLKEFGPGEEIDCDEPEGFGQAQSNWVASTPTVIFYDDSGAETGRVHTLEDLRRLRHGE